MILKETGRENIRPWPNGFEKKWIVIFYKGNPSKLDYSTSLIQKYHYNCNGLVKSEFDNLLFTRKQLLFKDGLIPYVIKTVS